MTPTEKLQKAMAYALANRPTVGGFPFLAECLRLAGVVQNNWTLPAAQSVYVMDDGSAIVNQGTPLVSGLVEVPAFDEAALIAALRTDQAGQSTFPEFLSATWQAGVTSYTVDFLARTVIYQGVVGRYTESYSAVEVPALQF